MKRVITVLHSMPAPVAGEPTRYADHMVGGAPATVRTSFFSWRDALTKRFDVFHIHWPEYLLRGSSLPVRAAKMAAFALLMLRLRVLRTAVVRTAHNLDAHEGGGRIERLLIRWNYRWTTLVIRLNPTTQVAADKNPVTILHGHYRDRFAHHELPGIVPGRMLYFGLIRPYKGVRALEEVFAETPGDTLSLRIVGKPSDSALAASVVEGAAADPRISCVLEFVPDEDLVSEIGQAQLVVLPYEEMHNSGSILVALSMGRVVLVPRSSSNEALAAEVGSDWVLMYDGPLSSAELERGLTSSAGTMATGATPDLAERDWATVGRMHYETYLDAISLAHQKTRESH